MNTKLSIPLVLALTLTTFNGGFVLAQRKPIAQQTARPIAQMSEIRGRVEIKRGQSNYRMVRVGEPLYMGDLVRVQKGARGIVRCTSNSTTWTVPDDGVPWGVANTCALRRS